MAHPARHPLLAITLMFGATASFVAMQAVVKSARASGMDTTEVMFFRTAPGLPLLWWMLRTRGKGLVPDQPRNLFVRSLFGSIAMGTNFTSMLWLSLAQFSTLGLSQPVFVALASPLLLKERIRQHTWLAMALAFLGALALLSPGLAGASVPAVPALLAIVSALASAFAHIWVRKSTETDPAERVVFHFAAWVSLGSLAVGLSRGYFMHLPGHMGVGTWALYVLGMAAFGTLGQVLMTRAHVYGEAATVSMVGYASVGLSMLLDMLLWELVPAASAFFGALLMLTSGIVLIRGERARTGRAEAPARTAA